MKKVIFAYNTKQRPFNNYVLHEKVIFAYNTYIEIFYGTRNYTVHLHYWGILWQRKVYKCYIENCFG